MSDSSYILMSDFLQAFLPFEILKLRGKGISELEREMALKDCREMLEPNAGKSSDWQGGAELIHQLPTSARAMSVLMRALAVLSFNPGGVEFCGVRYFGNESDAREWKNLQQMQE